MSRGIRLTEAELAAFARRGMVAQAAVDELTKAPRSQWRSKLEERFWLEQLEPLDRAGDLLARYECVKLRIGHGCWYTPDFEVQPRRSIGWRHPVLGWLEVGDVVTMVEVKGFWRPQARVKIKAAAARYPERRFVAVTWVRRQGWQLEEIAAR